MSKLIKDILPLGANVGETSTEETRNGRGLEAAHRHG